MTVTDWRDDSGLALPPPNGTSSGDLTVRGGVGGTKYSFEELSRAALMLADAAGGMGGIGMGLTALNFRLNEIPVLIQHTTLAARGTCLEAQASSAAAGRSLGETAVNVGVARGRYELAEGDAIAEFLRPYGLDSYVGTLRRTAAGTSVLSPSGGVPGDTIAEALARDASTHGMRDAVEKAITGHEDYLATKLGTLVVRSLAAQLDLPADALPFLAAFVTRGAVMFGVSNRGPTTIRQEGEPQVRPASARTLNTIIDNIGEAGEASNVPDGEPPRSVITVRVLEGAGGDPVYEVDIPGTTDWSWDGDGQLDMLGNTEAISSVDSTGTTVRPTQMGEAVALALATVGAPKGAKVILAGHSQGGLHVGSLAADPKFRAQYNVTQVVTAGSPIARFNIPESTRVTSLEHRHDWVAGLDGAPNPDKQHQVSVTSHAEVVGSDGKPLTSQEFNLMSPHLLDNYRSVAAEAAASKDPSLVEQNNALRESVPGIETETVYRFDVENKDTDPIPKSARYLIRGPMSPER